jgi:bacterioferritin-associated ferredoxin
MYICICNGVTEDDVRGCIAAGASTTRQVRVACGMKPGCGVCTRRLCAMLNEMPGGEDIEEVSTTAA